MNTRWILPNDSFIRAGLYLLKAAIEMLRSYWPKIIAVAAINTSIGSDWYAKKHLSKKIFTCPLHYRKIKRFQR